MNGDPFSLGLSFPDESLGTERDDEYPSILACCEVEGVSEGEAPLPSVDLTKRLEGVALVLCSNMLLLLVVWRCELEGDDAAFIKCFELP